MVRSLKTHFKSKLIIGWNEWCALPNLRLPAIKAKIDTGAKTSALHAFDIQPFKKKEALWVRFKVHPLQGDNSLSIECTAPVIDERNIMSSNGHIEHRYVISTTLAIGNEAWIIELTLSDRDPLKFRMLLGREALKHRTVIHPGKSTIQLQIDKSTLNELYRPFKHR